MELSSQQNSARRPGSAHEMSESVKHVPTSPSNRSNMIYGDEVLGGMLAPGKDAHVLGSRRPRPKKMWQTRYVKLLVVGDSGLGKTTLVRCLLAVPGENMVLHDGSSTSFEEFQKHPQDFQSSVMWEDADDHVQWVYQIQDTPGYGDDLDLTKNIDRVKQYIIEQNKRWLNLERSATRGELSTAVDPRVDIVIFCLPPHRVRNIDLMFMWEVSSLVPILPVVTKADTMTIKECISYRTELHSKLMHPPIYNRRGPINLFQFSDDTLEACGLQNNALASAAAMRPPYLVVCSNEYNQTHLEKDEPELWPERRYMWGTSEAMNPKHSDLLLLRRLLLQEGVEEISRSKLARYEVWRKSEMRQIRPMRKIAGWVLTTALTLVGIGVLAQASGAINVKAAVSEGAKHVHDKAVRVAEAVEEKVSPAVEEVKAKVSEIGQAAEDAKPKEAAGGDKKRFGGFLGR